MVFLTSAASVHGFKYASGGGRMSCLDGFPPCNSMSAWACSTPVPGPGERLEAWVVGFDVATLVRWATVRFSCATRCVSSYWLHRHATHVFPASSSAGASAGSRQVSAFGRGWSVAFGAVKGPARSKAARDLVSFAGSV